MKFKIICLLCFGLLIVNICCDPGIDNSNILAAINVSSGKYERFDTPVSLSLDAVTNVNEANLNLYELIDKEFVPVPVQFSAGEERRMHWLL